MKKILDALVSFIVGLLVLIVLAITVVCLFPITVIFAVLGLFYFVGTRVGWIDPKDYEKDDEEIINEIKENLEKNIINNPKQDQNNVE